MKDKGFTLIEILGVIIVLGIIGAIIYPMVRTTINDSQKNSYDLSVQGLVNSLESYAIDKKATLTPFDGCAYEFDFNYSDCDDLYYNGKLPDGGVLNVDSDGNVNGTVRFNQYDYAVINNEIMDYTQKNPPGTEFVFNYIDDYQKFVAEDHGYYKIEAWGASGGDSRKNGVVTPNASGFGGYTSGIIFLSRNQTLYVYVGGKGGIGAVKNNSKGGYNGGGIGTWDNADDEVAGGGGGATDIRLIDGEWNDFESLKSRIMVAGGGGGQSWDYISGYAGGLIGYSYFSDVSLPGTQTSGYKFGIGMDGYGTGKSDGVAGGGSGYYGGNTSSADNKSSGAGGSSFISGYTGCDAISDDSTEDNIIHTGQPVHYSGLKFIDGIMKSGNEEMPAYDGISTMIGNSDNGFVKITYLGFTVD